MGQGGGVGRGRCGRAGLGGALGLVQSLKIRLLAMLHVGFMWLGVAYGLDAASAGLQAVGHVGLGLAPLHALSMGFLGGILLAGHPCQLWPRGPHADGR